MKPLTNETLIEVSAKSQNLNWWGHLMNAKDEATLNDEDGTYAKCSKCGTVENTDESIKVCPKAEYIHISVLRSALQAKEEEMKEKIKSKKKYWHIRFEGISDPVISAERKKFNEEVSELINSVLDDLLSNLSEK